MSIFCKRSRPCPGCRQARTQSRYWWHHYPDCPNARSLTKEELQQIAAAAEHEWSRKFRPRTVA
jgi:hypothetical protein